MPEFNQNGYLERWYFNGKKCEIFLWSPQNTVSSNTFLTKKHCTIYCGNNNSEEIDEN